MTEMEPLDEERDRDPPAVAANTEASPASPARPASPTDRDVVTPKMAHDSMVTVRLSEPPTLTLDTKVDPTAERASLSSVKVAEDATDSPTQTGSMTPKSAVTTPVSRRTRNSHNSSNSQTSDGEGDKSDLDEVNWENLDRKEDEQVKDEETDNSTALLLARLEQENAKLATNPKSVKVQIAGERDSSRPRPPSMAQLREMVNGPTPAALRYSMLPPPAMTDLEFYAALVKDYQQTAARLPTLVSNKIRKGIPPPLRGVVWQSMSGARDAVLEEKYRRFCDESSPYELIIGKDLGRSFPGVDMFRDPEGDGQRMLGRVLKAFSLYDTKIGYCQGLAFLVGPLLMHMPDRQAFCILVRLMEQYDLRACFLPDLSGLHVRIYQFRELLKRHLPTVSTHLEELQVDPTYVSQWFLSFFAVTCPLPMLFRVYDVLFAEGASETLMRVALSLMRKNEERLMACTELEDVMTLLLSRGLWDCYHYDADEFVNDFVSLTSVVSQEKLSQLEQEYKSTLVAAANSTRTSDITTVATRFLGRIWASSTIISPKSASLTPGLGVPSRPLSMLRRSTSKQSLASTLNSVEASSTSVGSMGSTNASTVSRDSSHAGEEPSSRESTPVANTKSMMSTKAGDDRYLHSQIEDLLTAYTELQRNHALVTNQLQQEREERLEDSKVVRALLDGLKSTISVDIPTDDSNTSTDLAEVSVAESQDDQGKIPEEESMQKASVDTETDDMMDLIDGLMGLVDGVDSRFGAREDGRRSSMVHSKAQLKDELSSAKNQLTVAMSQSQELNRKINDLNQEAGTLRDQVRESHAHVRTLHQDKQRLEKQVHGFKTRSTVAPTIESASRDLEPDTPVKGNKGGLREFKLARSKSTPAQPVAFGKRLSSLPAKSHDSAISDATVEAPSGTESPSNENDALVLELVQAKTAEAVAKQEAEEAKQKLEAFKKAYGLTSVDTPPISSASAASATTTMGVFGRLTGQATTPVVETATKPAAAADSPSNGGFWGWRR